MAGATIDRLRDRVGDSVRSVADFTIERGKVAEFAAATGDDDPLYRDPSVAADRGYDRVPAPLTFTRASFFPHYRPPGAGRLGFDLGFDIRAELHGEQVYEFTRPVYVGDTLSATTTLTDAYERDGQAGGTMTFAVLETEFVDDSGAPVVTERSTLIEAPDAATADEPTGARERPEPTATPGEATVNQPADGDYPVQTAADVAVGDTAPKVVVEGLTPRDFVQYAGASGDFNPIHYDQEYARELGNPGVFGQGMLTMGFAAHVAADWFGVGHVREFGTRFTSRVWPGDTVTVTGEVTSVDQPTVTADLTATRQTGETVLTGDVVAELAADDA
jgi:peroxisomal enoyl-CoA hydratase 2